MNLNHTAVLHSTVGLALQTLIPKHAVASTVYFGVPDPNGNCVQVGICRMVLDKNTNQKEHRRCRLANALVFTSIDGSLTVFFPSNNILPCTERAIFKNKWLPVPVACTLPEDLLNKLEGPVMPLIAKGKYPITKVDDGYLISF